MFWQKKLAPLAGNMCKQTNVLARMTPWNGQALELNTFPRPLVTPDRRKRCKGAAGQSTTHPTSKCATCTASAAVTVPATAQRPRTAQA